VAVLSVSDAELKRLEVLRDVDRGGLPMRAAAQLLGRSERQVWRLLKAFRAAGVSGLISKKRGRPSNRKTAAAVRAAALWIVRHNYADFGPTLAAEKLAGEHGFSFSSETLRK
jgi:transposase